MTGGEDSASGGGWRRRRIPADRGDRKNLRYRRHLEHPWISAVVLWLILLLALGLPIAAGILAAGGIPPGGGASPDRYFAWQGSAAKGRSSAMTVLVLLGLLFAVAAARAGVMTRRERDEIRRIDADRIAAGVPQLAHNTTPRLEHRWFGRKERRRIVSSVPSPRAAPDHRPT